MRFNCLNELTCGAHAWKIKSRVIRLWEAVNTRNSNSVISLEMILLDEQGMMIQGTVRKQRIDKFKNRLAEGHTYVFENFQVAENQPNYKAVSNEKKIIFLPTTKITKVECGFIEIARYKFQFANMETIIERCNDNSLLTDVVGRVTANWSLSHVVSIANNIPKVELNLRIDSHNVLKVTIWDKLALELHTSFKDSLATITTLVLTSAIVEKFLGKYALSSTTASKVYVNLEIAEAEQFFPRNGEEYRKVWMLDR